MFILLVRKFQVQSQFLFLFSDSDRLIGFFCWVIFLSGVFCLEKHLLSTTGIFFFILIEWIVDGSTPLEFSTKIAKV